jgi:hypothetical protein
MGLLHMLNYIASNDTTIGHQRTANNVEFFAPESAVLARYLPGGNKTELERLQLWQAISWPRFEPRISRTRNRSAKHSTAILLLNTAHLTQCSMYLATELQTGWPSTQGLPHIHHKKRGHFPLLDHKKENISGKRRLKTSEHIAILLNSSLSERFSANSSLILRALNSGDDL